MKCLFVGSVVVGASACLLIAGVTVLAQPAGQAVQPATQAEEKEDASKGSKDVDRTIAYPMAQVLAAAKQALDTYGCDVKKEKADYLECTRDRHVGAFVGSGGEKVTVQLSSKGSETRIEIKTGKGFVGRLGKKNWSTPIFDDMMKTLKGS
jgi:hypothetical protein